jgi:hypothetical protein
MNATALFVKSPHNPSRHQAEQALRTADRPSALGWGFIRAIGLIIDHITGCCVLSLISRFDDPVLLAIGGFRVADGGAFHGFIQFALFAQAQSHRIL